MRPPALPRDTVLVIGHRQPDTDAVCSALAYAHLYTWQTGRSTTPCYLDRLAPETAWVLQRLGLPSPRLITDVYLRVEDVVEPTPTLSRDQSLHETRALLQARQLNALPVVDDEGRLLGMVERAGLADRFIDQMAGPPNVDLALTKLRRVLEFDLLAGRDSAVLRGRLVLAVQSAAGVSQTVRPGDVVIVGDHPSAQRAAVEAGASALIVVDGVPTAGGLAHDAHARGVLLLTTPRSALRVLFAIQVAAPISQVMSQGGETVRLDDLLADGQQALRESGRPALAVLDEAGVVHGLLMRRHLLPQGQREVILTDHNHADQAAPGVSESRIIAIVDHHNLGGLQTLQPLSVIVDPVGCTCTLIAEQAQRLGAPLPPAVAGAMLAAILSDTVQFRSPTTTPRDRAAAEWLAQQSGQTIPDLARAMFRARLPDPLPPAPWWVANDRKVFTFGAKRFSISQIELVDVEGVMPPPADLRAALAAATAADKLDGAFLLLTDILAEGSLLLADSPKSLDLAARAFGVTPKDGRLSLPGVMSRKKQVLPPLAAAV